MPRSTDAVVRRRLLDWYARHARDLPWRRTRDPYAIWVSEIMLQQTRVDVVLPYYRQFLRRFPSVRRLAESPLDDVLAAWAGLGYYRRARMLHAAAGVVVHEHGGRVPADVEDFQRLPGVGRYTAGAVLSIAFGNPLPVLDGNVARVLSRVDGLAVSYRDPRGARTLWDRASTLVPMRDPGAWNQALMELGATICTPRSPRCEDCPVARVCRARIEGRVAELPPAPKRRATVRVRRAVALVEWRGRWLVERLSGPLLDGMWEPPGVELEEEEPAGAPLREKLRALGVAGARLADTGERVKHTITHRRIEVEVWRGVVREKPRPAPARTTFVARDGSGVAITALAKKALGGG